MTRPLHSYSELQPLFAPKRIALIGASANPGGLPGRALAHLAPFLGEVYPVNPKYRELGARACYASVNELPAVPDLALIALPRDAVEEALQQCVAAGVPSAIVFASGYSETGLPDRVAQQNRLQRIAREGRLRLLGPNCLGIINFQHKAVVSFTSGAIPLERCATHAIGLVSQSGAVGFSLAQAVARGISFSHIVTAGNSCDVDIADEIAYLARDPECNAVACVFEGTSDPKRLLAAARVCEIADKALVVYKIGKGRAGAEAALSHTGALAGSAEGYEALFRQMNAVVVDDLEDLLDIATFFAKTPAPRAAGVALVSASGGLAIDGADKAELHSLPLPQPTAATESELRKHVPEFGSVRNPCDTTAQVLTMPGALEACVDAMLRQEDIGAVAVPFPTARESLADRIRMLGEVALRNAKPCCTVWTSGWLEGPGAQVIERTPGLALFRSMDTCMAALAAWQQRARRHVQADRLPRLSDSAAAGTAAALLEAAGPVLTERESKAILALYGVPVVQEQLVTNADEAAHAAERLGFPVVLKVESADIPHKTEAGGVRLGIDTEHAARVAFDEIMRNARAAHPNALIRGVLVQPMITSGLEIMVGARIDPALGALIVVSLGGIFVELLKDSVVGLAPLDIAGARELLQRMRGAAALRGFRGQQAIDETQLCVAIARLSEFAADHAASLQEFDVNPLICSSNGVIAVDALIRRATP